MNNPKVLTLKITEDEYLYIRTLLKNLMDQGFAVNDLKWYDYEYILYALECARKEGEMRLTSEEFASKMIEDFKPVQAKTVQPGKIEHAEKVEENINKKMEEEVKKVLPEEPVLEMEDDPVDTTNYDDENEVDNKEE